MEDIVTTVNDSSFWNRKYIQNKFKWDIGFPTPIFKNWSNSIKNKSNKKVCIPGCGRGHDVLYLSQQGFDVYAFDFSKVAIDFLNKESRKCRVTANIFCLDFFTLDKKFNSYFDYVLEYTFYCAISPTRRVEYIDKCCNILKNKGKIIAIMLPVDSKQNEGPPFTVSKDELTHNFENKFNILSITSSPLSIPQRLEIELYAEYQKK